MKKVYYNKNKESVEKSLWEVLQMRNWPWALTSLVIFNRFTIQFQDHNEDLVNTVN